MIATASTGLELVGLRKTYAGTTHALSGVTLNVERGMFGLLGPNGAGKSTLMRIVATLLGPDEGTFRLDGVDGLQHPEAIRHALGYLPQDFGVYPRVTTEAMLEHVAAMKGVAPGSGRTQRVQALLREVNLFEVRGRPLGELSGGMKRRFGVAQALLGRPRLLMLDEPTAGLDPAERHRFHHLLREAAESAVVIISTHVVDDVASLCERVAILVEGTIRVIGSPEELMALLSERVWEREVDGAGLGGLHAGGKLISRRVFRRKVRVRIVSDACPGDGFERATPTLEDVYLSFLDAEPAA